MESLAEDDGHVIFLQIHGCRQVVVLIPLITAEPPEFHMIQISFHELPAEVAIATPGQHDVHVGAIRGHKIAETKVRYSVGPLIDGGATARRMRPSLQAACKERSRFGARSEWSRLINPLVNPKFLGTKGPPNGEENRETNCKYDPFSAQET
jgi:hypothetical protein